MMKGLPATGQLIEHGRWFEHLFGFAEANLSMDAVRARFELRDGGGTLLSVENGASYGVGRFSTPSLAELRARAAAVGVLRPSAPPEVPKPGPALPLQKVH